MYGCSDRTYDTYGMPLFRCQAKPSPSGPTARGQPRSRPSESARALHWTPLLLVFIVNFARIRCCAGGNDHGDTECERTSLKACCRGLQMKLGYSAIFRRLRHSRLYGTTMCAVSRSQEQTHLGRTSYAADGALPQALLWAPHRSRRALYREDLHGLRCRSPLCDLAAFSWRHDVLLCSWCTNLL